MPITFDSFSESVIHDTRFIYSEDTTTFLNTVREISRQFIISLDHSRAYYRAQRGSDYRKRTKNSDNNDLIPVPYRKERMKPLVGKSKEGRANPKGIPCLYLGTDITTCIMETRPWISELITIGYFRVKPNLRIVNLAEEDFSLVHDRLKDLQIDFVQLWYHINNAFSNPIQNDDDTAKYIPTQIISELLKHENMDGVMYKSKLGAGSNIALFDIDNANCVSNKLYQVNNVTCSICEYY